MSPVFLFGVILIAVLAMIIAISKFNVHPFIAMVIIAVALGLVCGVEPIKVINTVKSGFGNILAGIGIVILSGTIIGTILEKTGAALSMANSILKFVGKDRSVLTMSAMGYVTGIPVFCDSGFVVLSPLSRALAEQSNTSLAVMATALSGGLYATHCLVPPTPGPIAMAGTLGADLGLTILVGLIVSIPAVIVSLLYAKHVSSSVVIPGNAEFTMEELIEKYGKLPGTGHSFAPIVVPIVLIGLSSIASLPAAPLGKGALFTFLNFIGNPVIALLIGILIALTLIPSSERCNTLKWVTEGVTNSAGILAITGAGGSFGAILGLLPIADATTGLLNTGLGVIIPFAIAAALKLAQGSSTVAMITAATMMAPVLENMGLGSPLGRTFIIMAIGAGSMVASHANDSYFWVVSQFSDMKTSEAYRCQTGMTAVMGTTIIVILYIASIFIF